MTPEDAGAVIRRHILKAREDRAVHRQRKGGARIAMTEQGLAGHKIMWLADLLREITGEVVSRKELGEDP